MPSGECLIYEIKNSTTGLSYVGSTTQPKHRIAWHLRRLSAGTHTSPLLQRSWNKNGRAAFQFSAVLVCDEADRDFWENGLITSSGFYNSMKKTGKPSSRRCSNGSHDINVRLKISEKARARHERNRREVYDPLCEMAWGMVLRGADRVDSCKAVGVSHTTFWKWIARNGLKERQT